MIQTYDWPGVRVYAYLCIYVNSYAYINVYICICTSICFILSPSAPLPYSLSLAHTPFQIYIDIQAYDSPRMRAYAYVCIYICKHLSFYLHPGMCLFPSGMHTFCLDLSLSLSFSLFLSLSLSFSLSLSRPHARSLCLSPFLFYYTRTVAKGAHEEVHQNKWCVCAK